MRYLSLFSGAGGFEHPTIQPIMLCEKDNTCQRILGRKYPGIDIHGDVNNVSSPPVDFVVGGWPCQDISKAGTQIGIGGDRSGLFFRMVDVARRSGAHTIIGENVPNLLTVNSGLDFQLVIQTLVDSGYKYIAWRTLNARQFMLPQERRRVFVAASRSREVAISIHAPLEANINEKFTIEPKSAGFYWTAGGRSICFNWGFTPTLKVGASDSKGRSVVAVFSDGKVHKLSAQACLKLQGLDIKYFEAESKTDIVRMAGNAVPVPMGQFICSSVFSASFNAIDFCGTSMPISFSKFSENGFYENDVVSDVYQPKTELAQNLDEFISDDFGEQLSGQAAAGLIVRSCRSGKNIPLQLFDALVELSKVRDSYRGSRSNSFEAIDKIDLKKYRSGLEIEAIASSIPGTDLQQSFGFD
jgi:DNA (cytosine-5)-methyltransferase 1